MRLMLMLQAITLGLATCAACSGQSQAAQSDEKPRVTMSGGSADDGPVTVIGGSDFQFVSSAPIPAQVVKGAPYSLEASIDTTQTLADGNRISHHSVVHMYRDSVGRTRREETFASIGPWAAAGSPPTLVTIQDPVAGVEYILDSEHKIASRISSLAPALNASGSQQGSAPRSQAGDLGPVTMRAPIGAVGSGGNGRGGFVHAEVFPAVGPAPASGDVVYQAYAGGVGISAKASPSSASSPMTEPTNEKSQSLGKETISGVLADGVRTSAEIPAGAIGNERPIEVANERWFSPELQIIVRIKRSDPMLGTTEYNVTRLDRAEPPHSLFEVPADYQLKDGGLLQTGSQ